MALKISIPVMQVLDAATVSGNRLVLLGELDRKLYAEVNKVLEAIGGKWNRAAKAHVFDGPVADVLDPILETGEYSRAKQDFGQFDSPGAIVERLIELADLRPGMKVYEPSAGVGNLIEGVIRKLGDGALVFGNEIDPKRHAACVVRHYRAFGAGGLSLGDFLAVAPTADFDRVVMNPPFAGQADIAHVLHAAKFLRPGGRLVSVMSAGVLFRGNRRAIEFRDYVASLGGSFHDLPAGSFSAAGTNVHTCIVTFEVK